MAVNGLFLGFRWAKRMTIKGSFWALDRVWGIEKDGHQRVAFRLYIGFGV